MVWSASGRQSVGRADSVGRMAPRTASGPRLFGAADANGVGMLATAWDNRRQDVGRLALGRQSGWGVCGLIGIGAFVGLASLGQARPRAVGRGFFGDSVGNGVVTLVWLLVGDSVVGWVRALVV